MYSFVLLIKDHFKATGDPILKNKYHTSYLKREYSYRIREAIKLNNEKLNCSGKAAWDPVKSYGMASSRPGNSNIPDDFNNYFIDVVH